MARSGRLAYWRVAAVASIVVVNMVCMAALICGSIGIKQLLGMIGRYTSMMPEELLLTLSLMHMRGCRVGGTPYDIPPPVEPCVRR